MGKRKHSLIHGLLSQIRMKFNKKLKAVDIKELIRNLQVQHALQKTTAILTSQVKAHILNKAEITLIIKMKEVGHWWDKLQLGVNNIQIIIKHINNNNSILDIKNQARTWMQHIGNQVLMRESVQTLKFLEAIQLNHWRNKDLKQTPILVNPISQTS